MISRHVRLFVLLAACMGVAHAADPASIRWYDSIEEASSRAREVNKPILLDFWAEWCAPCKVMEAQVYANDDFIDAARHFVAVRIDADKKVALTRKYNIMGLPTLVFTDSHGDELFRYVGSMDVRSLTELLRSLPHDVTEFNRLGRLLTENEHNFDALDRMGRAFRVAGLYRASNDYYGRALRRPETKTNLAKKEEILASMGANYLEVKEGKQAAEIFEKCLKEFPNSPRRPEWTGSAAQARAMTERKK